MREQSISKIKSAIGAARALVHNRSLSRLPIVVHRNCLETVGPRVTVTVLGRIQSYDKVAGFVLFATCSYSSFIEGPSGAFESSGLEI